MIIIGSRQGWPLSTTHCQVGATTAVAWLEGAKGVNYRLLGKVVLGWILTLVIVGSGVALVFATGAYAPTVQDSAADLYVPIAEPALTEG